jgi:hypothetical protein
MMRWSEHLTENMAGTETDKPRLELTVRQWYITSGHISFSSVHYSHNSTAFTTFREQAGLDVMVDR